MAGTDDQEFTARMEAWTAELSSALNVSDVKVDIDAVLDLAGVAAHAILRPAAPLTTYLAGYAAGLAAAGGPHADAAAAVIRIARETAAAHGDTSSGAQA
ncbi:MAG TPA: DUF6457 domain-containing protein [Pseudolysinimonas sp.]|nr:DUF6457 domain-containing protein [Pseudolysinimonas sp.]